MKQAILFFLASSAAFSVAAQQPTSALTITVTGNKNLEVSVDDRAYAQYNTSVNGNKTVFLANNLHAGQHTFLASRTGQQQNWTDRTTATFSLRNGYDMQIKLNGNGSLELIETKNTWNSHSGVPVSDAVFSTLLKNVISQRSTSGRQVLITNAFNKRNQYFTTTQVKQLLQQVNSESGRLQLAKLSYARVTDRGNFSQVYELLNSRASENALDLYVDNYGGEQETKKPVTDAAFTTLRNGIQKQSPVSQQVNAITSAFAGHYFTSYQAMQLIQLVNSENSRLQLAKASYESITDPVNFTQLNYLFNSQSSKDQLAAYVSGNNNGNPYTTGMTAASFNTLYQTIYQQWPASTQVNSVTAAFENTSHYFTSAQARQLIQLLNDENTRLQLAKLSYRSITDRQNFSDLNCLFSTQSSKDQLASYVRYYSNGNPSNLAMNEAGFNSLYQTIVQEWPVSTQSNSITSAFANTNNYFTVNQASRLIQIVTAESIRLQLAKTSYRSITDREHFSDLHSLLNSQSSRDQLTAYVNNYNTGSHTGTALSDEDFKNLHQKIRAQFFPNEKMNSLTEAFNVTTYFFTSSQAKQLIQLVSYESNRLELSKLSYRSITDKDNFNQLYDLLNSQASREELEAYVRTYKTNTSVSAQ